MVRPTNLHNALEQEKKGLIYLFVPLHALYASRLLGKRHSGVHDGYACGDEDT
jgi:hypothetical protein